MIKEDLAKKIAPEFNLSLNTATRLVQTLLDEIVNGLVSGSRIELRRFGVFSLIKQKPRIITLPSGEKIRRPAQKMVIFNPSSVVKKQLNSPTKKQQKPITKAKTNDPEMLDEYDFSKGGKGKSANKHTEGTNVVVLQPEVAKVFPDSESVNEALKTLIRLNILSASALETPQPKKKRS